MSQEKRRARQKLRDYQRLLSLEPGNPQYLAESGRLALVLERPREAARYYLQQAEALGEREQVREALTACRAALRCDPQLGRARKYLSQLLSVVSMAGPKPRGTGTASTEVDAEAGPTESNPPSFGDDLSQIAARLGAGIRARGGDVWRPVTDSDPPPLPAAPEGADDALPPPVPDIEAPAPPIEGPSAPPPELSAPPGALSSVMAPPVVESGLPVAADDVEVVADFPEEMELGADQVLEVHIEPALKAEGDFSPLSGALGPVRTEVETRPVTVPLSAGVEILMPGIFEEMPAPGRKALFEAVEQRVYGEGAIVHRAGERFDGPVLVIRGRLSSEVPGQEGVIPLPPRDRGQMSGFLELVRGGPWRSTGRALQRTEVIRLPVQAFDAARKAHPEWDRDVRRLGRRRLADHYLAASSLFGDIPSALRLRLADQFTIRHFDRGQPLFGAEAPAEGLHLLIAGEVDVEDSGGQWLTMGPGEFIGVVTAVQGVNSGRSALSATPVETLFLDPGSLAASLRVDEVRYRFERMAQRRQEVSG